MSCRASAGGGGGGGAWAGVYLRYTCHIARVDLRLTPNSGKCAPEAGTRVDGRQETTGTRVFRRDRLDGLIREYAQVACGDTVFGTHRSTSPTTGSAGSRSSADSPTSTTSPPYHPRRHYGKSRSLPRTTFSSPTGSEVALLNRVVERVAEHRPLAPPGRPCHRLPGQSAGAGSPCAQEGPSLPGERDGVLIAALALAADVGSVRSTRIVAG